MQWLLTSLGTCPYVIQAGKALIYTIYLCVCIEWDNIHPSCIHSVGEKTAQPSERRPLNCACSPSPQTQCVVSPNRYYKPAVLFICIILPTLVPWYFWGETLQHSLYIATFLRYTLVLNFSWLVNSAAHLYGYRPYDRNFGARENVLVSLVSLGKSSTHVETTWGGLLIRALRLRQRHRIITSMIT